MKTKTILMVNKEERGTKQYYKPLIFSEIDAWEKKEEERL